jgi:hypothetical protein
MVPIFYVHEFDGFFKAGANPEEVTIKVMSALTRNVCGFVCNLDLSSVLNGATIC